MADTAVAITAGAGTNIDTRTEGTNSNHRQVVVIGDPATNAGVAPVDVTNGLAVQVIPALPAGTNAIGKLAANSGVDIGDVDVTSVTPGSAATNLGKAEDAGHTTGDVGVMALAVRQDTPGNLSGTDADYEPLQVSGGKLWVANLGFFTTVTTDVTRAANTTTYAINDNVGSTPSGGYTLTSIARKSGGSGIITDVWFSFEEDAATPLQGELHIFDTSFTEVADNSAYVVSDAEAKTQIAIIPFVLQDNGNQGTYHAQNLSIGYTTVGSANLRFAIKAKNAYVPTTNSSVLSVRVKAYQID